MAVKREADFHLFGPNFLNFHRRNVSFVLLGKYFVALQLVKGNENFLGKLWKDQKN